MLSKLWKIAKDYFLKQLKNAKSWFLKFKKFVEISLAYSKFISLDKYIIISILRSKSCNETFFKSLTKFQKDLLFWCYLLIGYLSIAFIIKDNYIFQFIAVYYSFIWLAIINDIFFITVSRKRLFYCLFGENYRSRNKVRLIFHFIINLLPLLISLLCIAMWGSYILMCKLIPSAKKELLIGIVSIYTFVQVMDTIIILIYETSVFFQIEPWKNTFLYGLFIFVLLCFSYIFYFILVKIFQSNLSKEDKYFSSVPSVFKHITSFLLFINLYFLFSAYASDKVSQNHHIENLVDKRLQETLCKKLVDTNNKIYCKDNNTLPTENTNDKNRTLKPYILVKLMFSIYAILGFIFFSMMLKYSLKYSELKRKY